MHQCKDVAIGKGTCARARNRHTNKALSMLQVSHLIGQRDTLLVQVYEVGTFKSESGEGFTESSTDVVPGKMKRGLPGRSSEVTDI